MANTSMGEIISTLRKEKGMTQKDIANQLGITDKAVSKWERDIAFPDTATIPKLAEILGVSVEELMQAKSVPTTGHKGAGYLINIILKAVPLAMGVAVIVTSLLGELDMKSGFTMLGVGLASSAGFCYVPGGVVPLRNVFFGGYLPEKGIELLCTSKHRLLGTKGRLLG